MPINVDSGNKYISEIMWQIRESGSITSDRRQAEIMGLGYGTVNKLLNPSSSVKNLPDLKTLEAIAIYRNQKTWQLLQEIEDNCQRALTQDECEAKAIANIYRLTSVDKAINVNLACATHLNHLHQIQKASA